MLFVMIAINFLSMSKTNEVNNMKKIYELFPSNQKCFYAPKITYSNNWNLSINHLYHCVNNDPYNFNVAYSSIIGFRVNGEVQS